MADGWQVTVPIDSAHRLHPGYPLLPGDLLVRYPDGTWAKEAPGIAILGFELTRAQETTLHRVSFRRNGLDYTLVEPTP